MKTEKCKKEEKENMIQSMNKIFELMKEDIKPKSYKDYIISSDEQKSYESDVEMIKDHLTDNSRFKLLKGTKRCRYVFIFNGYLCCGLSGYGCTFCNRDISKLRIEELSDDEITVTEEIMMNTKTQHQKDLDDYFIKLSKLYVHNNALVTACLKSESFKNE